MKKEEINIMGLELVRWTHKSCEVDIAEGIKWATIYRVESREQGKGHATELLGFLKNYYKSKRFGGSVALSPAMKHLYQKLQIKEYL